MADNTILNTGTGGDTIATDDVTTLNGSASSGIKVQRVKLMTGDDGTATDVSATNPVPSQLTNGTNAVEVSQPNADSNSASVWTAATEAYGMMFNGTTWDRVRGTITNGVLVNVSLMKPDGTNTMPSMDVPNRAAYVELTDGTSVMAIDPSFGDAENATQNHLNVGSVSYGANTAGTLDRVRANTTTFKGAQYTTTQTGTALWTPAAGKAVCVTQMQIQVGGTVSGAVQVWFGATADTTYTRGTDAPIFDGEFAPSTTNKPGVYIAFTTPPRGTADYVLRVTTAAAINPITVTVWGYEI